MLSKYLTQKFVVIVYMLIYFLITVNDICEDMVQHPYKSIRTWFSHSETSIKLFYSQVSSKFNCFDFCNVE